MPRKIYTSKETIFIEPGPRVLTERRTSDLVSGDGFDTSAVCRA